MHEARQKKVAKLQLSKPGGHGHTECSHSELNSEAGLLDSSGYSSTPPGARSARLRRLGGGGKLAPQKEGRVAGPGCDQHPPLTAGLDSFPVLTAAAQALTRHVRHAKRFGRPRSGCVTVSTAAACLTRDTSM
eukprot:1824485-Rhodomonas_salina.4